MTEEQLLLQNIKDYAIFMLDTKGYITTWNEGAKRIKGYTPSEIIGHHFSIFYTEEDKRNKKPEMELAVAIATGRYEEEGWRVKKDGSLFWANVIITSIFNEDQKHVGFSKITRDLTERKAVEESLRKSEERYRLLVAEVRDYAIFMLDQNGKILSWNKGAEELKGYRPEEIIGQHFSIFYNEKDKAEQKPQRELVVALQEGRYEEEGWRIRKDGSRFWANVVITSIHNDEGKHIGFAKITRDLTERKTSENELRESSERHRHMAVELKRSNEELEHFAFIISHDLKEPLRKINMFGSVLLGNEKEVLSESAKRIINKMIDASNRMDKMIDDILALSRLSNEHEFVSTDLQKILDETTELLEQKIKETQAIIDSDGLIAAHVIPSQIRQLFQNLLSNSLKFAKPDVPAVIHITHDIVGKDEINTSGPVPAEKYLRLNFSDNGIGFQQEYAEKIFYLFQRLHGRSEFEGTGLGLSICQKVVENHGGVITAQSQPGRGSVFTVILPYYN